MGPEIFFNPEIANADYFTPLPDVVDTVIQNCPIDTRRGLYRVTTFFSHVIEYCAFWWLNHVQRLWKEITKRH
jgi:hypothetical protein